jgi:hypothetical protein
MNGANNERITRKININPFTNNFGTFNISLFISITFFYTLIYFNILITFNSLLETKELDYFTITTYIQQTNIYIFQYIFENIMSGLNEINKLSYINQYLPFDIIPNNINIKESNIKLTYSMYIIILLSIGLSIIHNILYIYQGLKTQNILSSSDLKTHYIPLYYLKTFYNRNTLNYIYIKKIKVMVVKDINKTHKEQIINLVFNKDYDLFDLKITNETHFLIYHITKLELIENEEDKQDNKENKQSITKKKKRPSRIKKSKNE